MIVSAPGMISPGELHRTNSIKRDGERHLIFTRC